MFWAIFFVIFAGLGVGLGFAFQEPLILSIIGIVLGIVVATSILAGMRKVNKNVQFVYGAANYVRNNSLNIDYRKSLFLYSKVTKTPRADTNKK